MQASVPYGRGGEKVSSPVERLEKGSGLAINTWGEQLQLLKVCEGGVK